MSRSSIQPGIVIAFIALLCCCAGTPRVRQDPRGGNEDDSVYIVGRVAYNDAEEDASGIHLSVKNLNTNRIYTFRSIANGLFYTSIAPAGFYQIMEISARRFMKPIPGMCVFEVIPGRANNIGLIRLMVDAENGPAIEFVEEYGKVEEEFSRQVRPLAWNEWIREKIYTGEAVPIREFARNTQTSEESEESEDPEEGGFEFFILANFTSYTVPFSGTTTGLGIAYTHTIFPGFLAPGFSGSAAIHPKSFAKFIGAVIAIASIFSDDDEAKDSGLWDDDDDDTDDDEEEGEDYPWRTDFTLKVFNEFRFNKISLRPFFGRMFLAYSYEELDASAANWISGAEVIYQTDWGVGLGMEFAYIIPGSSSHETDGTGIRCSVTLRF
ncbi:MAG: hypothetical protein LBK13_11445 [Spirochaetales bacterium]|nr:hypothetical protein [Spirochaetales bacterium]